MLFYQSPLAAKLYDLQHQDDPILEQERDFLLDEIAKIDGTVLDMGCGTGRILLPALQTGADVCGCDGSAAFLERLKTKSKEVGLDPRVYLCYLEDMPVASDSVSLAFAAFRTFEHLDEPGAQEQFLREANRILVPGGKLIINTANPDPMDLESAVGHKVLLRDDMIDPETGMRILWWGATRFDPETSILHESSTYDLVQPDGLIARSYHFSFPMRWVAHEEMTTMVEEAGFIIERCDGGFAGEPFEIGTGEAVWHLRRD